MTEVLPPKSTEQFSRLLTANTGRICAFIFTLVHDYDATQELMQEVSLVLWRKFETFDLSTDFAVWAMSVARLSVFEWRRTNKRVLLPLDDGEFALLADEAQAVARECDERKGALRQFLKD
jgi:RNA polymerase sigma-70 factor (ECF subfamily)